MDQDGLTVDASGNNKDGQDDGMYIAEGEGCITPSLQEASRLSKIRNPTKKSVRLRVTSGRIPNPNGDEKKKIDPRCYIHGDHRETTFEKHGEIQIALQTMEIVDRIALLPQPLRLSSLLVSNVPSEGHGLSKTLRSPSPLQRAGLNRPLNLNGLLYVWEKRLDDYSGPGLYPMTFMVNKTMISAGLGDA
ncbi:hypothetical protein F2Q68_00043446 [Brassica cretica]|uniref:Uncharacterized protein n=1 Tax=Brassica cretica TaxID=69181 RepID=A0A8S9LKP7_BRACR|nr:hypothetical protein F2Q68_00043446 [Brassica cretica]